MEFLCSNCNKKFDSKLNCQRHIDKVCKDAKLVVNNIIIQCEYCNSFFTTKAILNRHLKNCKANKNDLIEENKRLKEKVKQLELEKNQTQINHTTNNNITQVIVLNNYNETDLSKLTDKLISDLIIDADESYKIIPNLIKHVHFNSESPENHNICLPNKNSNNKYMNVFREGQWQAAIKNTEVDNIISDKETQLGDWVTEKGKKFPEAKEKYNDYLEQKYEPDIAKLIKEEVELVLYNGRHMIKTS